MMQKYRADKCSTQPDGATLWHAHWMGGPTLARINGCRIAGTDIRRAVYITGEPNTYFSQPAATRVRGRYVKGYITGDGDGNLIFHALDAYAHRLKPGAV